MCLLTPSKAESPMYWEAQNLIGNTSCCALLTDDCFSCWFSNGKSINTHELLLVIGTVQCALVYLSSLACLGEWEMGFNLGMAKFPICNHCFP